VSLKLCRFAGGIIWTKIMMAGPTAGQFPLICVVHNFRYLMGTITSDKFWAISGQVAS